MMGCVSDEECDATEHWTVAIFHEQPGGGVGIRRWRLCPGATTDQWLASAAAQLGEPQEEQIVTAEDVAVHRAAHAGDPALGVTISND